MAIRARTLRALGATANDREKSASAFKMASIEVGTLSLLGLVRRRDSNVLSFWNSHEVATTEKTDAAVLFMTLIDEHKFIPEHRQVAQSQVLS